MNLYIDLETVPYNEEITDQDILNKIPKNITQEETIKKKIEEERDQIVASIIKERSIDRYQCKIVCVSYAFDNQKPQAITGTEENILRILQTAILKHIDEMGGGSIAGVHMVGHNVKLFDAPVLYLRACKYGLPSLQDMLFYTRTQIEDTMVMGTYWGYKEYVSLKDLCRFFGRDTKEDMDGSKVYEYYKQGKIEEISAYCNKDVEDVMFLYEKLRL